MKTIQALSKYNQNEILSLSERVEIKDSLYPDDIVDNDNETLLEIYSNYASSKRYGYNLLELWSKGSAYMTNVRIFVDYINLSSTNSDNSIFRLHIDDISLRFLRHHKYPSYLIRIEVLNDIT